MIDFFVFDWTNEKPAYTYKIQCQSCQKISLHFSYSEILQVGFVPEKNIADGLSLGIEPTQSKGRQLTGMTLGPIRLFKKEIDIDSKIFYSVPTSYFVVDDRIPAIIRELITEAEGCLKMNFLTGASACMRKAIYELTVLQEAEGKFYEDKIKFLKTKFPQIDPSFFDTLSHIKDMADDKVHENSWDKWDSNNLNLIISTLKPILKEIYVVPAERKRESQEITKLRRKVQTSRKRSQKPGGRKK
jgi:hypothetical protein